MSVDTQDVIDRLDTIASQFAGLSDSVKSDWIDIAQERYINTKIWARAGKLRIGLALATAHLLTLDDRNQNQGSGTQGVGRVTSLSEGDQSISFSGPTGTGSDADLEQTTYGTQFKQIQNSLPTTPIVG